MFNYRLYRLAFFIFTIIVGSLSCTDDKDDESAAETTLFNDGKATLSFADAEAGDEYLILPYHLGNIDTVQGGTSSQSEFTVTVPSAASLRGLKTEMEPKALFMNSSADKHLGEIYRMIMNRFNSNKSEDAQDDGLWMLADTYDKIKTRSQLTLSSQSSMTSYLKQVIKSKKNDFKLDQNTDGFALAEGCPTTDDEVELFVGVDTSGATVKETDSISDVISNDDFCVILVTDALSDKLSDKTVLESTIKSIMDTYKNVIYEDTFPVKNGITFKPYFIIADFEDLVSLGHSSALTSIIGAFNQDLTVSAGRPVLLMTETLAGVGLGETDANVRQYWGTLAHEVSHAISYYYKNGLDDLYIDEGAAHTAEDLFGYKADGNYDNYASIFLQNRYSGSYPFFVSAALTASDSSLDSYGRGAGQALFHYLISQKGGITYSSGSLSTSDGLKFYADVIKSPNKGFKNLSEVYADASLTWNEVIGNYIAALMVDGSSLEDISSLHTTADVITNINNVQGDAGKEYGFKFNGGDLGNSYESITSLEEDTFELTFYQTKPFLYKVQSADDNIVIETLAENAGVAMVKVN